MHKMNIGAWKKESFIDYPGKLACIIFVSGCNYRCPACHAKYLLEKGKNIDEKDFFDYLDSRKGWIEGIVLCGGEPTLQPDLANFARKIKEKGLAVKLDTNGNNPGVLFELKKENLIDYVAMDVKGPSYLYPIITGKDYVNLKNIEKSIIITSQFPDYEFRTTIAPLDRRNGKIDFMTIKEVCSIAKWIVGVTDDDEHKYFLQPFVPRKGELVDSRFEKFSETPKQLLEDMKVEVRKYLPKCDIR